MIIKNKNLLPSYTKRFFAKYTTNLHNLQRFRFNCALNRHFSTSTILSRNIPHQVQTIYAAVYLELQVSLISFYSSAHSPRIKAVAVDDKVLEGGIFFLYCTKR
jgi:hypothetical protein